MGRGTRKWRNWLVLDYARDWRTSRGAVRQHLMQMAAGGVHAPVGTGADFGMTEPQS
jgi:hypothetical protein